MKFWIIVEIQSIGSKFHFFFVASDVNQLEIDTDIDHTRPIGVMEIISGARRSSGGPIKWCRRRLGCSGTLLRNQNELISPSMASQGRAQVAPGAAPTTARRTTTLTLFRETENPISQNATHSLCLSVYFSALTSYRSRIPLQIPLSAFFSPSFLFTPVLRFPVPRKRKEEFNSLSIVYELEISFFVFVSLFLPIAYFPICTLLLLSGSCSRVISILEWVNAYSKQRTICRYSQRRQGKQAVYLKGSEPQNTHIHGKEAVSMKKTAKS